MITLVQELKQKMHAAGVIEKHSTTSPLPEPLSIWDEIVYESVPGESNEIPDVIEDPASPGPIQIENQIMPLPSNGNVGPDYNHLELSHRISQADHHLNRIRDLIAEKSFQFSHVIRVAPRKTVNTRSRTEVRKVNLQISVHCRLYTQCRNRLIKLGAPPDTISQFRVLTVDDVKASTAIINPNEPGSTKLKLSWIWQSAGGHRWGLSTGGDSSTGIDVNSGIDADPNNIECKLFISCYFLNSFHIYCSSAYSLASRTRTTHEMARRGDPYRLRNAVDS